MINNICEIINQHANENVPRNIWGTFVLRRWGWRLTCQTCDDGRWTQRRPPKPSSWSPSLSCCHKARGRSAGYSRCFPAYRSAISLTCPLSLSSALSSCTPEGSYGTFLKVSNDFCDTKKGKSKDANLVVVPFASWGVDLNRIPESNSKWTNAGDSSGICKETIPHGTAAIRKLAGERKEKQERSQLPHSFWWSSQAVWKVWSWKRKKRFTQLLVAQLRVKHIPPVTLI